MSLLQGLLHRPKTANTHKPGPTVGGDLGDPLGDGLTDPLLQSGPEVTDDPGDDPNAAKLQNLGDDPTGDTPDGDPDDSDITTYRDRRDAAMKEQNSTDQLHTTAVSLDKAFPLYREVLAQQGDAVTGPTYERVHAAVNSEVFATPGQAAGASHVDANAVERLQTHVLNQYGGGHYALQLHDGIISFWRPQLVKYEDGEPDKGPVDLFRKKKKEWKRLAHNERAQKVEEWGVIKLLHKLIGWKQNKGPRLDEVTWLVESDAEARGAIAAHLANVSVPKPSSIPEQAAPPSPPPFEAIADLDKYAKALDPHLKLLNGGGFQVTSEVQQRKLGKDKVLNKHLQEVLPVISSDAGLHDEAQQTADALGLQVDWALSWASEEQPQAEGGKREVKGWLTVAGLPGLMELEMPVYDKVGGQVVQKVHLGDRLAWTGHIHTEAGEPWAEIELDAEHTGFVQARYTNGAAVVDQIKKKEPVQDGKTTPNTTGNTTTGNTATTPASTVPVGLEDRGLLVLRQPDAGLPWNSDVFGQGKAGSAAPGPFGLLTETGPGSTAKAEVLVEGKPVYADRKSLRPAGEADRIMASGKLDNSSIPKVRYALANDPDLQAEPARREAYNLRLQALAPTTTSTAPASNGKPSPTLASLASALVSLGVPSPYPDQSFPDALEMVRLEQGLKDAHPTGLATALGLGAQKVDAAAVGGQLAGGHAVLVRRGEVWIRVTGVDPKGDLTGDQAGKPVIITAAELSKLEAVALSVPAELDGDPAALEAAFVQRGVRLDAEQTKTAWKDKVYANTTAMESTWYLEHVKKDKARAGASADMEAWRPAAADGAKFAKADSTKLAEVVVRHYGPLGTAPAKGTTGAGLWPAGHADVTAFLDAWWAAAKADPKAQANATPARDVINRRFTEWAEVLVKVDVGLAQGFLIEVGKAPPLAGVPLPTAGIAEVITRANNPNANTGQQGGGTVAKKKDANVASFDLWDPANVTGGGSYSFSTAGRDATRLFYRVPAGTVTAKLVSDPSKTLKLEAGQSVPLVRTEAATDGKKKGRNFIIKKDEQEWSIFEADGTDVRGRKNKAEGTNPIWDLTYASTMTGADGTSSVEHNLDTHKRDHSTRQQPAKGKTKESAYYDMQVSGQEALETRAGLAMYKDQPAIILPNSEGAMLFDGTVVTDKAAKSLKPSASRELRRGTIGEVNGQTYFLPGRDSNIIEDNRKLWPISAAAIAKMQEIQHDKVKALEKSKEDKLTANQKDLLKKCETFCADASLASQYPKFSVPSSFLTQDGENLSGDLVARLQRMWQFFQYAGLVTHGTGPALASGIRGRVTAHTLSVRYSFHKASGTLKAPEPDVSGKYTPQMQSGYDRTMLMNNVLALEGVTGIKGKDVHGIQWAKAATIDAYETARQDAAQLANAGKTSEAEAAKKSAAEALWTGLDKDYKVAASGVDPKTGLPKEVKQTDPANEGFPTSDADKRWPTPSNVDVSNHCGGEAMDITFPLTIGMSDPIVDLIGAHFGLHRPIAYSGSEDWHWERVGINITR